MPRVPEYESQISRRVPSLRTPTVRTQPQAAFGGAETAANARLGESISRAGQALSGIAEQRMKMNAEKKALKLSIEFQGKLDDMLYSPENEEVLDENGNVFTRQRGILNQKLGHAKNAGIRFDNFFAELDKKYDEIPKSEYEQAIFNRMKQEHYNSSRNSVFRHQAREERAEYRAVIAASLERIKQSAAQYVNADDLTNGINRAMGINKTGLQNMGITDDNSLDLSNEALAEEIVTVAISSMLEKEPIRAQAIFEAVQDQLTEGAKRNIGGIIAGKMFSDQRSQVWEAMGGLYRRADGSYDKEAMRAGVTGLPGFNSDQKNELFNYAKARANESEASFRKSNAANDRKMLNEVVKMQNQNISIDERLKLATTFGRDEMDIRSKENAIRKMQDATVTDPAIEWALWNGIRDGSVTMAQLDDNQDSLSGKNFSQLRKELNKSIESPETSEAYKGTWDRIEALAERKYGGNKNTKTAYLVELSRKFSDSGGSPDQLWKLANDELAGVKPKWYQFFGGEEVWKVDAEKNKALSLLKGRLETDLGREVVDRIAFAIKKTTGKDSVDAVDIDQFTSSVGGVDAIKPGTPGYKAIQELARNKLMVTPGAIQRMIEYHPEWK